MSEVDNMLELVSDEVLMCTAAPILLKFDTTAAAQGPHQAHYTPIFKYREGISRTEIAQYELLQDDYFHLE